MLTLVLFNCFNLSFSAGIHWKYAQPTEQYYNESNALIIITLIISLITMLSMQFS